MYLFIKKLLFILNPMRLSLLFTFMKLAWNLNFVKLVDVFKSTRFSFHMTEVEGNCAGCSDWLLAVLCCD